MNESATFYACAGFLARLVDLAVLDAADDVEAESAARNTP